MRWAMVCAFVVPLGTANAQASDRQIRDLAGRWAAYYASAYDQRSHWPLLGKEKAREMKFQADLGWKNLMVVLTIAMLAVGQFVLAQNLGTAPATNVSVQGQTAAQPEGAFLNFINWIGNGKRSSEGRLARNARIDRCPTSENGLTSLP